jgi:8-oxo-dGTP pyrophosphatase MutT (NUDIX family)
VFSDLELHNLGRATLLQTLRDYAAVHPDEAALVEQYAQFVRSAPRCFDRSQRDGHVTASALVLSTDRRAALLLHHRKLDRWLQPGGHADGDPDTLAVAIREVFEETGLRALPLGGSAPFDLDIHPIPARGDEPAHYHYDVRYLLAADNQPIAGNDESLALKWFALESLIGTAEPSIQRMARKVLSGIR